MRTLSQINRTLNIHVSSKTEEDNNRVYNISTHQDRRYLNTSRLVGKCTIHPEHELSEGNIKHPEYDLTEGNTMRRKLSLSIRQGRGVSEGAGSSAPASVCGWKVASHTIVNLSADMISSNFQAA